MKSLRSIRIACCLAALLLLAAGSRAQGWQRTFPGLSQPYAVQPTPDGGAAFIATSRDLPIDRELAVVKTDADGRVQWQQTFGGPGDDEGRALILSADQQSLLITGRKSFFPNNGDVWLAKLGLDGTLLWEQTLNYGVLDEPCCLRATADGGYLLALETDNQLRLLKTDAAGYEVWTLAYPQTVNQTVEHLEITPDGGYLITLLYSNPPIAAPVATVLRTDAAGAVVFERSFQHLTSYGTTDVARAKPVGDDRYWLAHRDSVYLLDAAGLLLQARQVVAPHNFYLTDFLPAADGGLWALGTDYSYLPPSSQLWLSRLEADGSPVWTHPLPIPNYAHSTWAAVQHADGGFLLTGNFIRAGDYFSYLLRTDSLGQIFSNQLTGHLFWDQNNDCQTGGAEPSLAGWPVKITHPNGEVHYASTDSLGNYSAPAGLGQYTVAVVLPTNSLWAADCAQDVSVLLDTTFTPVKVDFSLAQTADCPLTWVDLGLAGWLPCVENTLAVRYANQGTATAQAAEVVLRVDSLLAVVGASIPYAPDGPFTYRFPLGDLAALHDGAFTVQVIPACAGLQAGQTRCVSAHILPDAPCLDPLDGPLIVVEGRCDADSVRFRVQNKGANMPDPLEFVIIEGDIMLSQNQFQLAAAGETTYGLPANGSTWRFEARQAPGLPDWQSDDHVAAVVEGCTTGGIFDLGYVNQFSLFDGGNFDETECREVLLTPGGSAKVAYPGGYLDEHFIGANTDLEYALHFQNTGADTVRFAVLRDTFDAGLLDPATVAPGPSSHAYTFGLQEAGVLVFRFDSLNLPPGALGWVKFRVSQQPDLPNGVVIRNRAGVGFDYAAPVVTNETFHTITAPLLSSVNGVENLPLLPLLTVWPVPATVDVWVEMPEQGRYRAELRDVTGRLLRLQDFSGTNLRLSVADLPAGVFVLTVWEHGQRVGTAQVIKNE